MSKVLKASDYQKRKLHGERRGNAIINFEKDADGNWITSVNVLRDARFADLESKLKRLVEIDYKPIVTSEED